MTTVAAFMNFWQRAGTFPGTSAMYHAKSLLTNWRSPLTRRHYHTLEHLAACLATFEEHKALAQDPLAVELALWCHDAIYDPQRGSYNEVSSALLAERLALKVGWFVPRAAKVKAMVLATTYASKLPIDNDTGLVLDIDLSILGADAATFEQYEVNIRREYDWVKEADYCEGRAKILQRFLDSEHIYHHAVFRARYEAAARRNLTASIAALKGGP